MPDVEHYITVVASTTLLPTPLVPEVSLYCAENAYDVWSLTDDGDESAPMPFWSFPWAGGQALARYLLDHPNVVAGRRVLDLAAGLGARRDRGRARRRGRRHRERHRPLCRGRAGDERQGKRRRDQHRDGRPARRRDRRRRRARRRRLLRARPQRPHARFPRAGASNAGRTCCWATLAAPICRASDSQKWPVTTSRRRLCSKTSKRSGPRSGRCAPTSCRRSQG